VDAAVSELRVDGGASVNDLLMQFQADLLGIPVVRPKPWWRPPPSAWPTWPA
jgi:glycerol kinase